MREWRALCETIEIRDYGVYCFSHLQPLPLHLQPSLITHCVVLRLCSFFASYETRRGVTKFLEATTSAPQSARRLPCGARSRPHPWPWGRVTSAACRACPTSPATGSSDRGGCTQLKRDEVVLLVMRGPSCAGRATDLVGGARSRCGSCVCLHHRHKATRRIFQSG